MRQRRSALLVLLATAAVVAGGCATSGGPADDPPPRELAGRFDSGPGESWFRACGAAPADPAWWVTFTGESVAQVARARAEGRLAPGRSDFVRWRASVVTDGRVGPNGPGVPALLVRELLEARPAAAGDCGPSAGSEVLE